MSINRAILLGNVGKDPEVRSLGNGDKVATFRLATSEYWKDKNSGERKETTEWHTVVCFNQALCGVIEEHVTQGSKVSVQGKIKHRKWQDQQGNDRYSTEIVIDRFDGGLTLEGRPGGGQSNRDERGYGETRSREPSGDAQQQSFGRREPQPPPRSSAHLDDDIPF